MRFSFPERHRSARLALLVITFGLTLGPALAQSTLNMDWSKLDLAVFADQTQTARGLVCLPSDNQLVEVSLSKQGRSFVLEGAPLAGKVTWNIR